MPYERFSEVNTKFKTLEKELTDVKPLVEAQRSIIDHCVRSNVRPEQFQYWLNIAALANTDPEEAMKQLQPMLEEFQGITGDKLPQDLQQMVNNQEISLPVAKRLAVAEGRMRAGQKRTQLTEQQLLQNRQQMYVRELTSAFDTWLSNRRVNDPDFKPKAKPSDPDGKFELFMNKFSVDAKQSDVKSGQDLVNVAESAYTAVEASVKQFIPRPNGAKVLSSTRSATTTPAVPKTIEEVVAQRATALGISPAKR